MKLWSLLGNSQRLDGGAMFGNAPKALWQKWLQPDRNNSIPLACRCLLAQGLNGRNVLFETGIGNFFEPKLRARYGVVESHHVLRESLQELGVAESDIDVVVLSHLHFDHAGGLLSGYHPDNEPQLLFPNASYLVGRRHWERANHPHVRDRASFIPVLQNLLQASGRLELVDDARSELLGTEVSFTFSDGHTPGLMLAELAGVAPIAFCADLIPGLAWLHVPISMGYDRYPEKLVDEKRAFLEEKAARGVRLFFTHDPTCAMASVERDQTGRYVATQESAVVQALEI